MIYLIQNRFLASTNKTVFANRFCIGLINICCIYARDFQNLSERIYAHRETFFDMKQLTWVKNAAKSTYHSLNERAGTSDVQIKWIYIEKIVKKDDWVYNDKQKEKKPRGHIAHLSINN